MAGGFDVRKKSGQATDANGSREQATDAVLENRLAHVRVNSAQRVVEQIQISVLTT